jgi:XTP/dITP diphosphohydrolase
LSQPKILLASRNKNKLKELVACLQDLQATVVSLDDVSDAPEVEEDGKTFKENATKKATEIARATGLLTVADDSGLEVDALQGGPGVRSSRYAGENATDRENNEKLLREMAKVPEEFRGARFVCAIAVADADGLVGVVEGSCEGSIAIEETGRSGFGYDPLFILTGYNKTFAELGPDVKNRVSHRFRAMEKAALLIEKYLAEKRREKETPDE